MICTCFTSMCFLLAISYDNLCLINCCINRHHESINNTYTLVFVHVYIALLYTLTLSRGFSLIHLCTIWFLPPPPLLNFFPNILFVRFITLLTIQSSQFYFIYLFFFLSFFLPNSEKINLL